MSRLLIRLKQTKESISQFSVFRSIIHSCFSTWELNALFWPRAGKVMHCGRRTRFMVTV